MFYGFLIARFIKNPATVSAVKMINAGINPPVDALILPARTAANGWVSEQGLECRSLTQSFFVRNTPMQIRC